MIILPGTSDIVRVVTGLAVGTDVIVSYIDHTTTTYTPSRQLTTITTATTTTICSAPGGSTQRQIKHMTINARGGAQTLVLQYFDGTNAFQMVGGASFALATGETLQYTDEDGFVVVASASVQQTGRLLREPQYLTAGSSITHPIGTNSILVEGVGGGGASGGTNNLAAGSVGAAGASGTWGRRKFTAGAATSTYAVGAAGVGVSNAAGGAGASSTFTHNGTTVTLPGGPGGAILNGAATVGTAAGGVAATAATNADVSITGQPGGAGWRNGNITTTVHACGPGGSNPLGQGGPAIAITNVNVTSSVPVGFGSGAGGKLNGLTSSSSVGIDGRPGLWIVWEYS